MQANESALTLTEVVFDDEIRALVAFEGDEQVVADAVGDDALRAQSGRGIHELIAGTANGLNMLRTADCIEAVLTNPFIGSVKYLDGDLSGHGCFPEFHYVYVAKISNFLAIMKG